MKRVFIFYYIMIAALVFIMLVTIYNRKVYDENEKSKRIHDDYDVGCIDCFNSYDHFYDDYQLYNF